jgi:hypothetical protein
LGLTARMRAPISNLQAQRMAASNWFSKARHLLFAPQASRMESRSCPARQCERAGQCSELPSFAHLSCIIDRVPLHNHVCCLFFYHNIISIDRKADVLLNAISFRSSIGVSRRDNSTARVCHVPILASNIELSSRSTCTTASARISGSKRSNQCGALRSPFHHRSIPRVSGSSAVS